MSDNKLDIKASVAQISARFEKLRGYSFIVFVVFVSAIYGFVVFRINSLNSAEPTAAAVTGQVQAAQVPHIDKSVVDQLESLQDNSVSVHALFDKARSNPFQ